MFFCFFCLATCDSEFKFLLTSAKLTIVLTRVLVTLFLWDWGNTWCLCPGYSLVFKNLVCERSLGPVTTLDARLACYSGTSVNAVNFVSLSVWFQMEESKDGAAILFQPVFCMACSVDWLLWCCWKSVVATFLRLCLFVIFCVLVRSWKEYSLEDSVVPNCFVILSWVGAR